MVSSSFKLLGWAFLVFIVFIGAGACSSRDRDFGLGSAGANSGGSSSGGNSTGGVLSGGAGKSAGGGKAGMTSNAGSGGMSGSPDMSLEPKKQGEACSKNEDCQSTACRDAVCCDTTCEGPCQACVEAQTSSPDGTCAPVLAGADPHDDCETTSAQACGNDGSCDGAGACRKFGSNQVCADAACSASDFTAARTCDGKGACSAATSTKCGAYPCSVGGCQKPCTQAAECGGGAYCGPDKVCRNQLTDGAACTAAGECRSTFCVDGVCCESACSGTCSACSQSKTGQVSGRCVGIPVNQDPDNECAVDTGNACGREGTCSGGGACRVQSLGSPCGTAACSGSTLTPQGSCDGVSSCSGGSAQPCPGNLVCASATACRTTCTADSHCNSGYFCSNGSCLAKKAQGTACSAANECTSASCRDGFCCNSACSLACQACSNATSGGTNGVCAARSASATKGCPTANPTSCIDLSSDPNNCGGCGTPCPNSTITGATRTCTQGVCGATCPAGTLGDGLNVCIPVSTIAADEQFTCALLSTGKVQCWGDTSGGLDPAAAGVSNYIFTSISAAWNKRVCGIRDNGQIVCWGSATGTRAGPYIALAMSSNHACAIKANQTLDCWSTDNDTVTEAEPSGKYKGIAAMDHYSCAIISGGSSDGKLTCWGDSGNYDFRPAPTNTVFTRVIGGANHGCGIKADKTITCWGLLYYPEFPAATTFKTLGHGGSTHYCGILTDDSIFCWGSDGGVGGPAASEPAGAFKALALGAHHVCGVTTAGRVVCAGSENSWGQSANQPGPFLGFW